MGARGGAVQPTVGGYLRGLAAWLVAVDCTGYILQCDPGAARLSPSRRRLQAGVNQLNATPAVRTQRPHPPGPRRHPPALAHTDTRRGPGPPLPCPPRLAAPQPPARGVGTAAADMSRPAPHATRPCARRRGNRARRRRSAPRRGAAQAAPGAPARRGVAPSGRRHSRRHGHRHRHRRGGSCRSGGGHHRRHRRSGRNIVAAAAAATATVAAARRPRRSLRPCAAAAPRRRAAAAVRHVPAVAPPCVHADGTLPTRGQGCRRGPAAPVRGEPAAAAAAVGPQQHKGDPAPSPPPPPSPPRPARRGSDRHRVAGPAVPSPPARPLSARGGASYWRGMASGTHPTTDRRARRAATAARARSPCSWLGGWREINAFKKPQRSAVSPSAPMHPLPHMHTTSLTAPRLCTHTQP